MRVPKCKQCICHRAQTLKYGTTRYHWCWHPKYWMQKLHKRWINSAEFRTSPKWCPRRRGE